MNAIKEPNKYLERNTNPSEDSYFSRQSLGDTFIVNKIEKFLNKIYKPKINPKKRNKLFKLSLAILIISTIIASLQFYFGGTKEGVYLLCMLFELMALTGIAISKYGSDFLVALFYGEWRF